jgi:putative ABC transport system ATP-binding protein
MLVIEQLRFGYSANTVLEIPQWHLPQGEHCLVLGASGCGKTTLLHLIAGLLTPQQGEIWIAGHRLSTLRQHERDRFRGQHIGIVFQQLHLISALTVMENLFLTQRLAQMPRDKQRIQDMLSALDLEEYAHHYPTMLSQGQAQRVALARAVLNRPCLLLADEPTAHLDDTNCLHVLSLLKQHAQQASLVIATHDQRLKHAFQSQPILELSR